MLKRGLIAQDHRYIDYVNEGQGEDSREKKWLNVKKRYENMVVQVHSENFVYPDYKPYVTPIIRKSCGTAFFVADTYLLTNAHCVIRAKKIYIIFRQQKLYCEIISICDEKDLALLRLRKEHEEEFLAKKKPDDKYIVLGDEMEYFRGNVRDVMAIGFPLGHKNPKFTNGEISGIHEEQIGDTVRGCYLQTTAAINKGNSGGPLVDIAGNCLGICSAGYENSQNVGLAIPTRIVKSMFSAILCNTNPTKFCMSPSFPFKYILLDRSYAGEIDGYGIMIRSEIGKFINRKNGTELKNNDIITKIEVVDPYTTVLRYNKENPKELIDTFRERVQFRSETESDMMSPEFINVIRDEKSENYFRQVREDLKTSKFTSPDTKYEKETKDLVRLAELVNPEMNDVKSEATPDTTGTQPPENSKPDQSDKNSPGTFVIDWITADTNNVRMKYICEGNDIEIERMSMNYWMNTLPAGTVLMIDRWREENQKWTMKKVEYTLNVTPLKKFMIRNLTFPRHDTDVYEIIGGMTFMELSMLHLYTMIPSRKASPILLDDSKKYRKWLFLTTVFSDTAASKSSYVEEYKYILYGMSYKRDNKEIIPLYRIDTIENLRLFLYKVSTEYSKNKGKKDMIHIYFYDEKSESYDESSPNPSFEVSELFQTTKRIYEDYQLSGTRFQRDLIQKFWS